MAYKSSILIKFRPQLEKQFWTRLVTRSSRSDFFTKVKLLNCIQKLTNTKNLINKDMNASSKKLIGFCIKLNIHVKNKLTT